MTGPPSGGSTRAGIAPGNITVESSAPSWEHWDSSHLAGHGLVASSTSGEVVGWAARAPVSDRCAYAGVAESSVYIDPDHPGRSLGQMLLDSLVQAAERSGIWTVQSGIFPENAASIAPSSARRGPHCRAA